MSHVHFHRLFHQKEETFHEEMAFQPVQVPSGRTPPWSEVPVPGEPFPASELVAKGPAVVYAFRRPG